MQATVEYKSGMRFEARAGVHSVVVDQPLDHGGEDLGMTPPDFLLVSLGSCMAHYAAEYLRTRSLPVEGLTVKVQAEKQTLPARLGAFRVEIHIPVDDAHHQLGVERAVRSCLIHNTLLHTPSIKTVVVPAANLQLV